MYPSHVLLIMRGCIAPAVLMAQPLLPPVLGLRVIPHPHAEGMALTALPGAGRYPGAEAAKRDSRIQEREAPVELGFSCSNSKSMRARSICERRSRSFARTEMYSS
jgi:hypothetical protein